MKINFNLFQSTYNYVVDDAIESFNLIKCAINCIIAPNSCRRWGCTRQSRVVVVRHRISRGNSLNCNALFFLVICQVNAVA